MSHLEQGELSLEKQHSIEWDLGRDLTEEEIKSIGDCIKEDEEADNSNQNLIALCLIPERFIDSAIAEYQDNKVWEAACKHMNQCEADYYDNRAS